MGVVKRVKKSIKIKGAGEQYKETMTSFAGSILQIKQFDPCIDGSVIVCKKIVLTKRTIDPT